MQSVKMSRMDSQVIVKLEMVLQKLTSCFGQDNASSSTDLIGDDTVLQKLHTNLDIIIHKNHLGYAWAESIGLIDFIQKALDPNFVCSLDNSGLVAFSIKVLGSVLSTEEEFNHFADEKVMMDFFFILPNLRNDPTLTSAALTLAESLQKHRSGLSWLLKHGAWEKLLLPSLRSPSIFVQRKGVMVIASYLLLLLDTEHFKTLIKDLAMISEKFCELRRHVNETLSEEIRQSCLCVLLVFKEILTRTLGETALYSKLEDFSSLGSRLLYLIERQPPLATVTHVTDVLILNTLHSFQEKVMEYGIVEQFLMDMLCADMISLAKVLLERGYMEAFFRSSVNMHKYWKIFVGKMEKNAKINITSEESLLHILTSFQVTPILVLYKDLVAANPTKEKIITKWNEEIHSRINIKESVKVEAAKVETQMTTLLDKDKNNAVKMAVVGIAALVSTADHMCAVCAVTVFQGLIFLLCLITNKASAACFHEGLQRSTVDGLRVLVEKFEIDWRKCYASVCLMGLLCDMMKIQNMSTQVKVSILKVMKSCVSGFIPPVMSMLVNSELQSTNSVEQMGQVLTVYLADMEWEVRDSALEVLITCMNLAKDKYPHFVEWMFRYNLISAVLTALDDVEGYVRSSAYNVLSCVVSMDKVWAELEDENLQHRALASVLWEGDTPVRKSAICLVKALFSAGKFSEADVHKLVINIIQKATEDTDNEIRLCALEFIDLHIQESLQKSGMVDGEFPSVTFSKGKITKLDRAEVQKRVLNSITWFCETGYLSSLLICINDPVTDVQEKARDIFRFLNNLINKYDIKLKSDMLGSKISESKDSGFSGMSTDNNIGGVTSQNDGITEDTYELDRMDKAIDDILHSSILDNVASIKRSAHYSTESYQNDTRKRILTGNDVPLRNPAISVSCLLQSASNYSRLNNKEEDDSSVVSLVSLLDDILLDGCKVEEFDADDQRVRDCY